MRPEAEASRRKILLAMVDLLEDIPYDRLTIRQVCERAAVSRPTFYAHFAGKDDIFRSFWLDSFNQLCASRLRDPAFLQTDAFAWSIIDFYDEWPRLFVVMDRWGATPLLTRGSSGAINHILRRESNVGYVRDHPPYFLSFAYEPVTSVCLRWVLANKPETREELFRIISYYRKAV